MARTIEMRNISKSFGEVKANTNVNLTIKPGEVLALLGENGSGKTTLMNMLSGIYYPDSGSISIDGKTVKITSPKDALSLGIGMVYQHLKLIDVFSASENVVLGLKDNFFLSWKKLNKKIHDLSAKFKLEIDPKKKIYNMSISERQRVEIIKLLYRGVETLILDEPTAVLTPQETDALFDVLREMKKDGKSIILITHKLDEVMKVSDRVAIMRAGELVETAVTSSTDEEKLADMMVGKHVELKIARSVYENEHETVLEVKNLTCIEDHRKTLQNVSFSCKKGEILGIAGVSGSGQKELLEAIAGLQKIDSSSSITYYEDGKAMELVGKSPKKIHDLGIHLAFVPEDRLGMGLVANMDIVDNVMLRTYSEGKSPFLKKKKPAEIAAGIKDEFGVVTPSLHTPIKNLSGGNIQKVLVGRELFSKPKLLLSAYATRGLDINTSYEIYNLLNEEKKKGTSIIYVGEDLDVLLALADKILVLSDGKMTALVDASAVDKRQLGLYMAGKEIQA